MTDQQNEFEQLRTAAARSQQMMRHTILEWMEAELFISTLIDKSTNREHVQEILNNIGAISTLVDAQLNLFLSQWRGLAYMLSDANGFSSPEDRPQPPQEESQ